MFGGLLLFRAVDIEGSEFAVFDQLAADGTLNFVDQLSIEIHFSQSNTNTPGATSGVAEIFALFKACEDAGLLPFSWEANYCRPGYLRGRPAEIEYSFVRATSSAMRVPPWRTAVAGAEGACANGQRPAVG